MTLPLPPPQLSPPGALPAMWDEKELLRIRQHIAAFDLQATTMVLPLSGHILLGQPDRDRDLEQLQKMIQMAGRVGIRVLTYSFTALRASEGYAARRRRGRGGADLRDFDVARIRTLPPLPGMGAHSQAEMWERLVYFLRAVVPVAEAAGVRLAAHPNDPPVPEYRGVAQPLSDLDGWRRLIDVVDSPANTLFFDTGVATELGEDAVAVIHEFGRRDRIGTVHFRNVQVEIPRYKYVETFLDDGDCDMGACMRALHEIGYAGGLDPDHTPGIIGDGPEGRAGWAFAVGYMLALRRQLL